MCRKYLEYLKSPGHQKSKLTTFRPGPARQVHHRVSLSVCIGSAIVSKSPLETDRGSVVKIPPIATVSLRLLSSLPVVPVALATPGKLSGLLEETVSEFPSCFGRLFRYFDRAIQAVVCLRLDVDAIWVHTVCQELWECSQQ